MSNLLKKLILSFLSALIVLFSFAPFLAVKAAATPAPTAAPSGTWYNQSFGDWFSKVYDENVSPSNEIFGERYTAAQVQWVVYGLWALIINGVIPQKITSCVLTNTVDLNSCGAAIKSLLADSNSQSKLANLTLQSKNQNLWSLVFATNRPLSGISYINGKIQNFSLIPVAHAAGPGFGFDVLSPVQSMWTAARNVAFGLFVIAAVVLSFMIMFRVKISPQVIVSVQSAIPKLVIALILVTFSYAIAGLLIDLMYVVIGILSVFASSFLPFNIPPVNVFNFLTLGQPLSGGGQFGIIGLLFIYIISLAIGSLIVLFFNIGLIGSLAIGVLGIGIGAAFGPLTIIVGAIILLIILVLVIWNFVKIFWMLLKTFVNILLLTIFAPLQIVAGILIPNLGFGNWLKSYIANLLTFVVTGAIVLFMFVFLAQALIIASTLTGGSMDKLVQLVLGPQNNPNLASLPTQYWPPLLGSGNSNGGIGLLFLGVSFVLFTLIPKVNDIIASVMSGKPFAYGSAIGEMTTGTLTAAVAAQKYGPGFVSSLRNAFGGFTHPNPPTPPTIQAPAPPTP